MAHVPVIVISPSDRRLEGMERVSGGPVIHSKLDVGTCGDRKGDAGTLSRMVLERGGDRRAVK